MPSSGDDGGGCFIFLLESPVYCRVVVGNKRLRLFIRQECRMYRCPFLPGRNDGCTGALFYPAGMPDVPVSFFTRQECRMYGALFYPAGMQDVPVSFFTRQECRMYRCPFLPGRNDGCTGALFYPAGMPDVPVSFFTRQECRMYRCPFLPGRNAGCTGVLPLCALCASVVK